jgi:hypothetical protein
MSSKTNAATLLAAALLGMSAISAPQTAFADTRPGVCSGNVCVVTECNAQTCEIWRNYYTWNFLTNSWDLTHSTYEVKQRYVLEN